MGSTWEEIGQYIPERVRIMSSATFFGSGHQFQLTDEIAIPSGPGWAYLHSEDRQDAIRVYAEVIFPFAL